AGVKGVVEVTWIINMIALEQQHRESLGDKPLVDLDAPLAPQPRADASPAAIEPAPAHRSGYAPHPPPPRPRVDPGGPTPAAAVAVPRRAPPTDPRDLLPTK